MPRDADGHSKSEGGDSPETANVTVTVVRALYDYDPRARARARARARERDGEDEPTLKEAASPGNHDNMLAFRRDDVIRVLATLDSGWWDGVLARTGARGWFPSNFCTPLYAVSERAFSGMLLADATVSATRDTRDDEEEYDVVSRRSAVSASSSPRLKPPAAHPTPSRRRSSLSVTAPLLLHQHSEASPCCPAAGSSSSSAFAASRRPSAASLPPLWGKKITPEGRVYYFHMVTNETTWSLAQVLGGDKAEAARSPKPLAQVLESIDAMTLDDDDSNDDSPEEHSQRATWDSLTRDILRAIRRLNVQARRWDISSSRDRLMPLSSRVIEAIRRMLYASGTGQRDSLVLAQHQLLRANYRYVMVSLSKLVFAARLASGLWPPPDSVLRMQHAASNVLLAVRHFSAAAQSAGIHIISRAPRRTADSSSLSASSDSEDDEQQKRLGSNIEVARQLERYLDVVGGVISEIKSFAEKDDARGSSASSTLQPIITLVRTMVTEVGNFLALVDELPFDALLAEDEQLQVTLKMNQLALYNCISGLVGATQTATGPMAPAGSVSEIVAGSELVFFAVRDLLVSTKFLIEEKENHDLASIESYISQHHQHHHHHHHHPQCAAGDKGKSRGDSDEDVVNIKHRRAISLDMVALRENLEEEQDDSDGESQYNAAKSSMISQRSMPSRVHARRSFKVEKQEHHHHHHQDEDILLHKDGSVRGGRIHALVERLALQNDDFGKTFALTARSFVASKELVRMVVDLYGRYRESVAERRRLEGFLSVWVAEHCLDVDALDAVRRFAVKEGIDPLIVAVDERVARGEPARGRRASAKCTPPPPIFHKTPRAFRLTDLDPLEVARQLTLVDAALFCKMTAPELVGKAWSVGSESTAAPNVRRVIRLSTQITVWAAQTVLMERDVKKRSQVIKQLIYVAEHCKTLNNFNTLMALVAGLNSSPVHRLKRTWELVSSKAAGIFEGLRALMSPAKNFGAYREHLRRVRGGDSGDCSVSPCIPFLGVYLTDLTFIEDGNPDYLRGGGGGDDEVINWGKRTRTAAVVTELLAHQEPQYALRRVDEIQMLLASFFDAPMTESELYDLSLQVEPREREDEKISRLLHESGFL